MTDDTERSAQDRLAAIDGRLARGWWSTAERQTPTMAEDIIWLVARVHEMATIIAGKPYRSRYGTRVVTISQEHFAALSADERRLDWLETEADHVLPVSGPSTPTTVVQFKSANLGSGATLRQHIDVAMTAPQRETPDE